MEITSQYIKYRRDFGRQAMFCEQGPVVCDSINTNKLEHKNYMLRNPVHTATQHTPLYSANDVNTIRAEYSNSGANHAEGGWPKDVNILDPEATQRYRRKIEKDDNYINCVMSLSPGLDHYILQNNAIDMYRTYYAEMELIPPPEKVRCRTVNVYRDPQKSKPRNISSICWQPGKGSKFAVTYLHLDFNRNPVAQSSTNCYIWDVDNANEPEIVITPPCALLDLQYNERNVNTLAGGLVNGQVGAWDRRLGGEPTLLCPPHVAHRDLVRNVLFINAKSGQEFYSGGPDGCCKWWDLRNMSEPTDEMIIDVVKTPYDVQSIATSNGICVCEFEPTIPTRFMVGTENGLVIGGNRKGKTPMEKLPAKYEAHVGCINSLERNPAFLKNFLTVGDWTARVWSEECRESAVIWSPPLRHKVTAATWSPTRISVMIMCQWNGLLSIWDLLRRQHEPVLSMQVCSDPLERIRIHKAGSMIACGSRNGNVYMAELSNSLVQSSKNDKNLMTLIFERESKRERILEARLREIRLKQRQAAEERSPQPSSMLLDPSLGDRDLAEATAQYQLQDECRDDQDGQRSDREHEGSLWQREEARCAVVLDEVLAWLSARQVCCARGVCRAWRRAALQPALWRRLLYRDARLHRDDLRSLAARHVSWYEEYVKIFAGWDRRESVPCAGGGSGVVDAALAGSRLALLTDDAALTIWCPSGGMSGWRVSWRCALSRRGWRGAARALWAAAGARLLLAGPLALVDHWELLVLQFDDEDDCGHVVSRTRCSAGAAGCWVDVAGDAFLSFELTSFAPSVACTTVWLNSATQETHSEHTGVRSPLFRIYNETGEHLTMAAVVDAPLAVCRPPHAAAPHADHGRLTGAATDLSDRVTQHEVQEEITMRVLVTTSGCREGGGAVCAWGLAAARPAAVRAAAAGDLRQRALRAAAAPRDARDATPPTAREVRAVCAAPDDACALPAPPLALAPHHTGRCVWVSLASGEVWCLSAPTLRLLRRLAPCARDPPPHNHPTDFLYYVRLAVSDEYVASPVLCGGVRVWRAPSGGVTPATSLPPLTSPALVALLPPAHPHTLLVLTADTLHIWRNKASNK